MPSCSPQAVRSTEAETPSNFRISAIRRTRAAPSAAGAVGPRLGQGSKLRLGVHYPLHDAEQVERAARKPVDPRHRHHVAGAEFPEHLVKFAPVGPRPRHLLAVVFRLLHPALRSCSSWLSRVCP